MNTFLNMDLYAAAIILSLFVAAAGIPFVPVKADNLGTEGRESLAGTNVVKIKSCLLWEKGKSSELKLSPEQSDNLTSLLDQHLRQSDDMLHLLVTQATLQRFRSGRALEVVFVQSRSVYVGAIEKDVELDQVMITINDTTPIVIFQGLKGYASGPFVCKKCERKSLEALVESIVNNKS
jgi:hypothetical protein